MIELIIRSHTYWKHKSSFLLYEDIYPYWCVFIPEEGRFRYGINGDRGEAGFGDLILAPPGTPFQREVMEPLTFHFIHFTWSGDPSFLPVGKVSLTDTVRLSSTFHHLQRLSQMDGPPVAAWKNHLLTDLWELYHIETNQPINFPPPQRDIMMTKAAEWIRSKAHEPLSLRELAEYLELSPVQLTRRFQAAYLMTPSEFLTSERLSIAARLLTDTALTLDSIARQCGYENGFYLSRVFTKKMKMSPSEYRRTHRI